MDVAAAKMIGAGLAVLPLLGIGLGLGKLFSSIIESISRNPSQDKNLSGKGLIYFALIESMALFALVISMLILFS